jgi:RNA polymerase sigma-70 factor (ECF subfamily)
MGTHAGVTELNEHRKFLERTAQRILGDDPEVQDVVQEAYLAALRRGGEIEPSPRAWLFRVTINLAKRALRSQARRERREALSSPPAADPGPVECAIRRESQRLIAEAVDDLETPQRDAVRLRFFEELDYASMARRLSVNQEAVRSCVRRAVQLLRLRLDRRRR